jgi:hypothetical protein
MKRLALLALGSLLAVPAACSGDEGASPGKKLPGLDASVVDSPADAGLDSDGPAPDVGPDAPSFDGPAKLSETGLYADFGAKTLAAGVAEYDVRFPLWSDGASKRRYLLLPPGTTIDTTQIDVWKFPEGTRAWKEFTRSGKLVETRFLWKRAEGWLMVAYLWNEAGTEAFAQPAGQPDALGTKHDVPSVEQCQQCHNGVGDVLIGVSTLQLSKEAGGGYLATLMAEGRLSPPLTAEEPVPGDGVVEDALGYLHGNCGHCHNDQSFVGDVRPLRLKLLVGAKAPEDTPVYKTAFDAPTLHPILNTTKVIVKGKPGESQLYQRMNVRDLNAMPPVGTEEVDSAAMTTLWSWIAGLPP